MTEESNHTNNPLNSTINSSSYPNTLKTEETPNDIQQVYSNILTHLSCSSSIGASAAAAVTSGRKNGKHTHTFETNPAKRSRLATRLIAKMKNMTDEYAVRVGKQVALVTTSTLDYFTYGTEPLTTVLTNNKHQILKELHDRVLDYYQTPPKPDYQTNLPLLICDGIPTPLHQMTQSHLRKFIPTLIKHVTKRRKTQWGKPEAQPVWWPSCIPWANVRCDTRSEEQKKEKSYNLALREIVRSCYVYYNREDLLYPFESNYITNSSPDDVSSTALNRRQSPSNNQLMNSSDPQPVSDESEDNFHNHQTSCTPDQGSPITESEDKCNTKPSPYTSGQEATLNESERSFNNESTRALSDYEKAIVTQDLAPETPKQIEPIEWSAAIEQNSPLNIVDLSTRSQENGQFLVTNTSDGLIYVSPLVQVSHSDGNADSVQYVMATHIPTQTYEYWPVDESGNIQMVKIESQQ